MSDKNFGKKQVSAKKECVNDIYIIFILLFEQYFILYEQVNTRKEHIGSFKNNNTYFIIRNKVKTKFT